MHLSTGREYTIDNIVSKDRKKLLFDIEKSQYTQVPNLGSIQEHFVVEKGMTKRSLAKKYPQHKALILSKKWKLQVGDVFVVYQRGIVISHLQSAETIMFYTQSGNVKVTHSCYPLPLDILTRNGKYTFADIYKKRIRMLSGNKGTYYGKHIMVFVGGHNLGEYERNRKEKKYQAIHRSKTSKIRPGTYLGWNHFRYIPLDLLPQPKMPKDIDVSFLQTVLHQATIEKKDTLETYVNTISLPETGIYCTLVNLDEQNLYLFAYSPEEKQYRLLGYDLISSGKKWKHQKSFYTPPLTIDLQKIQEDSFRRAGGTDRQGMGRKGDRIFALGKFLRHDTHGNIQETSIALHACNPIGIKKLGIQQSHGCIRVSPPMIKILESIQALSGTPAGRYLVVTNNALIHENKAPPLITPQKQETINLTPYGY